MEQYALGELCLDYNYFYSITPRVFSNISAGRNKAIERDFKEGWERARAVIVAGISPHLPKGANKKANKVYPLPWDFEKGEGFEALDPLKDKARAVKLWQSIDNKK